MTEDKAIREARDRWQDWCQHVKIATVISAEGRAETPLERGKRLRRLRSHYDEFCEYYFPHYLSKYDDKTGEVVGMSHNAPFHNAAAKELLDNKTIQAVYMWPRGHAKSTHLGIFVPCYLMFQEIPRIHVGALVNKSEDGAVTLLGDLQAELETNQRIIADFGEQRNRGSWEDGKFTTTGGVTWFAFGRGQSPRGVRKQQFRPDYILIDDLDDDEMCRNEARVAETTEWVKTALFGTLDVGRGKFIMVGNLISKTSVLANIAAIDTVKVSKVYAVDKDNHVVWTDKWTDAEAQAYADFVGYIAWQKEMMHNPIQKGGIFRWEWIQYKKALPLNKYEEIVCYVDPSFKSTTKNDYKAARVWGKAGNELHLLDCFVRQATVGDMVRWLYNHYESMPQDVAVRYYMEANFMQDIIMDEFTTEGNLRGYQLPILPDKRKKPDKLQRIEAISPLWERGFVWYNEALRNNSDMTTGIDQTLALQHGSSAHDDAPDADEGAIYILQRSSRAQLYEPTFGRRPKPKNIW